ncbi:MAG: DNA-deoxyinosine glycosylase [Gammaproteobacteria bacterium]|nr:DNA-deoxyinosine glycosylase [Gammaproteobacteria bacterium]
MAANSHTSTCFTAIANDDAHILVLGSMPGVESLNQQRYYAHPRNAFWPIITTILELEAGLSYQQRCASLIANKIALWDVLQSCQRQGSLDSNIEPETIIVNNFTAFLQQHPALKVIVFNGAKAEQIFNKYVLPTLSENQLTITRKRLPSTSPAHAAISFQQKCVCWQQLLREYVGLDYVLR